MNSQAPTACLVKTIRQNETLQISNIQKSNGEFTKSPQETLNQLLDELAPGSRNVEDVGISEKVNNFSASSTDLELIANICSLERLEAAIGAFKPFKMPGPDGLYPILFQKGWKHIKKYYKILFQACLKHGYVPKTWKEGTGIFLPKPGKENYFEAKSFRMITLTSFQLKWLRD